MYNIPVVNRNITHKLRSSTDRCVCRSSYRLALVHTRLMYWERRVCVRITHAFNCTSFRTEAHTVTQRNHSLCVSNLYIHVRMDGMAVTIHRIWTPQYDCILNLIHALIKIDEKKYIIQLIFVCHSSESGAFLLLNFYLFAFVWWWPLLLLLPSQQYFNRTNIRHSLWRGYVRDGRIEQWIQKYFAIPIRSMPKGLLNWR